MLTAPTLPARPLRPGLHPDGGGEGGADDRGVRRGALLVLEFAIRSTVSRRPRLLAPAVGERAGVVRPVADRVEKLDDGNLRPGMVSGDRQVGPVASV